MRTLVRSFTRLLLVARVAAGVVAISRIAKAARVAPPVRPTLTPVQSIAVVVPARDEAARIGPLLDAIVGAPGVQEVIVVDDQSSDGTADIATAAGARVVPGVALPDGWAGKAWALQQGIEAAASDWVVTLDADARPDPRLPTAVVARAVGDRLDLLTVGGRFECPTAGSRWLHPAMLTTLVYRFGPPGAAPSRPDRTMANGQCMVFPRTPFLASGGMERVRNDVVEDLALARHLATDGQRVGFLDASELLTVRMFESFGDVWNGWGRSLALPGVEPRDRQLFDLAIVVLTQVLPLPRLLLRRGTAADALVDVVLAAARLGTLFGTRRAYDRVDAAYWASPLADPLAALAIARGSRGEGARPGGAAATPDALLLLVARDATISQRRHREAHADERHQHPSGSSAIRTLDGDLHHRERNEPDAGGDRERATNDEREQEEPDRDSERDRGEHGGATSKRENAPPATETREHRERVPDHRGSTADVRHPPVTRLSEGHADERSDDPFQAVADEHWDRRRAAKRLAGVPEARVAVTDLSQVDVRTPGGNQIRDRDRSDQVADHDRDCHIRAHR